ncbi:MAG TPA: hypothetical protein VGZ73_02585, partial [Bryobacteraceae bacterium]|nr:hypothetical protein [Bryobacteraceae bacterium]
GCTPGFAPHTLENRFHRFEDRLKVGLRQAAPVLPRVFSPDPKAGYQPAAVTNLPHNNIHPPDNLSISSLEAQDLGEVTNASGGGRVAISLLTLYMNLD